MLKIHGNSYLHSTCFESCDLTIVIIDCKNFELQVRVFETHCGSLTQYGMKHMRAFANICNSGVSQAQMEEASWAACDGHDLVHLHPSNKGYSA